MIYLRLHLFLLLLFLSLPKVSVISLGCFISVCCIWKIRQTHKCKPIKIEPPTSFDRYNNVDCVVWIRCSIFMQSSSSYYSSSSFQKRTAKTQSNHYLLRAMAYSKSCQSTISFFTSKISDRSVVVCFILNLWVD